jgi:hypothetical protein
MYVTISFAPQSNLQSLPLLNSAQYNVLQTDLNTAINTQLKALGAEFTSSSQFRRAFITKDSDDKSKNRLHMTFAIAPNQFASRFVSNLRSILQAQKELLQSDISSLMNNLYDAWKKIEESGKPPITPSTGSGTDDLYTSIIGVPTSAQPAFDPQCDTKITNNCPKGVDTSTVPEISTNDNDPISNGCFISTGCKKKGINIGVIIAAIIVPIVVVLILFIITICLIRYFKKNNKCCWSKTQEQDEIDEFTGKKPNKYQGSIASPTSTLSSLSILPVNTNGVELSSPTTTTTSQDIKTVNNHTEIEDPKLVGTDWKKYKNAKAEYFYVNQITMKSSWKHPCESDDQGSSTQNSNLGLDW